VTPNKPGDRRVIRHPITGKQHPDDNAARSLNEPDGTPLGSPDELGVNVG
jgi:hypothetical protein